MRVAILGRTGTLLRAAKLLVSHDFEIPLVGTCLPASYDGGGPDEFSEFARVSGAEFFCDSRINSPEIVEVLRRSRCDVALSLNWLTVVGAEACAAFPSGILNVHAGDLPRYRGNACPNWAMLNGESKIGLTVHRMAPHVLDAGPVLLKSFIPVSDTTYIGDVYSWMENTVPHLCVTALTGLRDGTARFVEQDSSPANWLRCYPRRPEDGAIDWCRSATEVHRLVRASSRPFDGAFTYLDGNLVRVWRAEPDSHLGNFLAVPGQVMARTEHGLTIACGAGVLSITDIEITGLSGADALARVGRSLRNRLTGPA